MSLTFEKLSRRPHIFRKLTGLSLEDFDQLSQRVAEAVESVFSAKGRKPTLQTVNDKLMVLLMYYRTYISQEFLGYIVGLHNSNVCRLLRRLEPLLAEEVAIKKDRTLTEAVVTECLIDATEQETQRPKISRARKNYYSGKKKRHTLKFEISMTHEGRLFNVSKSRPGRMHDITLRRESDALPMAAKKRVDLGYKGLEKTAPNVLLPHKKTKGGKLTKEQKAENRQHSKARIAVEHKIREIKSFKILGSVYRNFRKRHHLKVNIIAGIVNMQHGF